MEGLLDFDEAYSIDNGMHLEGREKFGLLLLLSRSSRENIKLYIPISSLYNVN